MNGREMRRQRGETLMGWVDRLADGVGATNEARRAMHLIAMESSHAGTASGEEPDRRELAKRIVRAAAKAAGASEEELRGKSRAQRLVMGRVAAAQLLSERGGMSQPECGRELRRDHSTINYYLKQGEWMREHDAVYREIYCAAEKDCKK